MSDGGFIYKKRQENHLLTGGSLAACDRDQTNTNILPLSSWSSGIRVKKMEVLAEAW